MISTPLCWHCGRRLDLPEGRLSVRATCDHCSAYLHCCANCRHYRVGAPNDCLVPNIELVADKEKMNHCEEFELLGRPEKKADPKEAARRLFGDEEDGEDKKPSFSDLFK